MEELQQQNNPFEINIVPRKRRKKPRESRQPHRLDELAEAHELTRRYKPKYLGKGGENLVYELEGRETFVVKAQMMPLAKTIAWNEVGGLEAGDESIAVEELRVNELPELRKRFGELREVFGEHALPQKYFVMQVPVGPVVREELNQAPQLHHINIPDVAEAGWTIVSLQKRAEALEDRRRLSMGGANLELRLARGGKLKQPQDLDLYRRVTNHLMDGETALTSAVEMEELKTLMSETPLRSLLQKAERDPGLAQALVNFQRKAVEFSEKTEDILDLAGQDNIVFNQKPDGSWDYTIIDGLYPFGSKILHKAGETLVKNEMGFGVGELKEQNAVIQAVNYVRVINGLGKVLNTGAYIDLTPKELMRKKWLYSNYMLGENRGPEDEYLAQEVSPGSEKPTNRPPARGRQA